MSTDAASKVAPVAAPAKPAAQPAQAKPAAAAAAPVSPAAPKPSPEQLHQANRMDRIKTAVADAKKKSEDAAAKSTEGAAEGTEPVKPVTEKPEKVEPPTVIKTEKKEEKPVVPAGEVDPIDAWKLPENASAESVKNFSEIRTEAKARKQRETEALAKVTTLEAQLATYRNANPADVAATEQLKTQLKEAHDRLAIFDLKSHPDFVKQYVEPINGALAEAREVIQYNTKEGDPLPDLGAMLAKGPKEFNAEVAKLTKDMNQVDANIVITSLRNAHKLNAKQGEVLGKSSELATQLQQKSAQQAKAAFEEVSKNLGPSNDFLQPLEIVDGLSPEDKAAAEGYNASLASVRANAEKLAFGRIDERGVSQMAYKAATLEHMIGHTIPRVQAEFRKIAALCAEQADVIKQLRGGKGPEVAGGGGGEGKVDVSKMSIEERVKYRLAEARRGKQR